MKIKRLTGMLLPAVLLLLAGCDEEKYSLKFSHYIHVTDNEMDCDECHGETGQPSFAQLSHATCVDCHEEVEADEINQETCGYCHQEKQVPLLQDWEPEPVAPARNIFVHTEALAKSCVECHGSLMAEDLASVPALQRVDILKIRDEAHDSGKDCSLCHEGISQNTEPVDHDALWMKRHGMFGMQDDASCSVCHSEDSCRECHSVMQPQSHNNMFRMKTHGALASWDRQQCMVCHEVDTCTSCHSEARPKSHNARWNAPGKRPSHCISCHTSATAGEGCVVCHEEGNDLLLHESFWPAGPGAMPDHNLLGTAVSCYECHWTTTP